MHSKKTQPECIDDINFNDSDMQRSKLHKKEILNWMKIRNKDKTQKKYLYYPQEMKTNMEIKNVFLNMDKDGSAKLDMDEMFQMFKEHDFNVNLSDLEKLYQIVDDDRDAALNWQEFKKCFLNQNSNELFTQIMRQIRQENQSEPKDREIDYIPMSFPKMISFLSYCSSRDELLGHIRNNKLSQVDKMQYFQELFKLTQQYQRDSEKQAELIMMQQKRHTTEAQQNTEEDQCQRLLQFHKQQLQQQQQQQQQQQSGGKQQNSMQPKYSKDLENFFKKQQERKKAVTSIPRIKRDVQSQQSQLNSNNIKPFTGSSTLRSTANQFSLHFNNHVNSLFQSNQTSRSQPRQTGQSQQSSVRKVPFNLKEIDKIINLHSKNQQNLSQLQQQQQQLSILNSDEQQLSSFKDQKRAKKLSKLREDVSSYVQQAKQKYGLNLGESNYCYSLNQPNSAEFTEELKKELLSIKPEFSLPAADQKQSPNSKNAINNTNNISRISRANSNITARNRFFSEQKFNTKPLNGTDAIPFDILKNLQLFRQINEAKIYKTVGHKFYVQNYQSNPISVKSASQRAITPLQDDLYFQDNQLLTKANNSSYYQILQHAELQQQQLSTSRNQSQSLEQGQLPQNAKGKQQFTNSKIKSSLQYSQSMPPSPVANKNANFFEAGYRQGGGNVGQSSSIIDNQQDILAQFQDSQFQQQQLSENDIASQIKKRNIENAAKANSLNLKLNSQQQAKKLFGHKQRHSEYGIYSQKALSNIKLISITPFQQQTESKNIKL